MSTSRTFQMKMVRPDEEEMAYFWKLFYAAQRVEDRWGYGLADISEELSYCPGMTREQKLFLLRAWQVLAADKGGFGRFMGAYDTYVHNMQDPDDDCVAWKPNLIELFGNAELLLVVIEAYEEAKQRIAELEAEQTTEVGQQILIEAIGAHGYIVGCLNQGRPDLALAESLKWVEAFSVAAHEEGGE